MTAIDLDIFRGNDIRGVYPTQIDASVAYAFGQTFAKFTGVKNVAVGHDVRTSGPELTNALINGLTDAGVNVVNIGPVSTEMLYFAVGHYGYDGGVAVTASHTPRENNGFKVIKKGCEPITRDTGIVQMRDMINDVLANPIHAELKGSVVEQDIFADYKTMMLSFIDVASLKPMTIVTNANFGFQQQFAAKILAETPIQLVPINGDPDGTFPKGRPDPFLPENRPEFLAKIKEVEADLGVAWDADADRIFFATEEAVFVEGAFASAMFSRLMLEKHHGERIVYDIRYIWLIQDIARELGSEAFPSKVGHAYIKQAMRDHDAIYCGETSGHMYFREFFYCDTGMLPFLLLLEYLSTSGKKSSQLVKPIIDKYFVSGEINQTVHNAADVIAAVKEKYVAAPTVDDFDGITIADGRNWRFNLRASETEPSLLRLNVEAATPELVAEKRDEVLEFSKTLIK